LLFQTRADAGVTTTRRQHQSGACMPTLNRRELIGSLVAGAAWGITGCRDRGTSEANATTSQAKPLKAPNGDVDWRAVRALFPLSPDIVHMATFLFVSHPKPVAEAID